MNRVICNPFLIASENGHVDVVNFLISKNADVEVTNDGWTPLMKACNNNRAGVVRILVEEGNADMGKMNGNKTALDYAKERDTWKL